MTQALIFTSLIPLALLAVFSLVVVSGKLTGSTRARVERFLAWIVYPALVVFWGWLAIDHAGHREWVQAAMMTAVALVFVSVGAQALRTGRLFIEARPRR